MSDVLEGAAFHVPEDEGFRIDTRLSYLWIASLLLIAIFAPKNGVVWGLLALTALLLWPRIWRSSDAGESNKTHYTRLTIAAVITAVLAIGAWRTAEREFGDNSVRDAVAAQLRDPASAQFRDLYGEAATCGEVNGRNAFGAYGGFKKFVYAEGEVLFEPEMPISQGIPEMTDYYNQTANFARAAQRCFE